MSKLLSMKLSDYIKDKKTTQAKVGAAAGISKAHISQICRLGRRPSPEVAVRISRATNGEVTVLDLLYPDGIDEETESVAA